MTVLKMVAKSIQYTHFEHRHNFAAWCAARAVQRGFTKTPILIEALERSGLVKYIKENENKEITEKEFDRLHEKWCNTILEIWDKANIKGSSYGRAAKLVAVYIKSMIVVKNGKNSISQIAHPPIDRIILQNISYDKSINHPHRQYWRAINWTELNKELYLILISDFRKILEGKPFWHLEQYWKIND